MDEDLAEAGVPRVGERLRAAREEKGLSLEDVAAQTRIPQRHLESLEESAWDRLPAPTYTVGFAKNYAGAVGLDRAEIGEALREEMGGQRFTTAAAPEVFEPADPARTMPKWLVLGAILGVILIVVLMSWLNHRSLEQPDDSAPNQVASAAPAAPAAPVAPQPAAAQGPVVLNASQAVWLSVKDNGQVLKQGIMQPGESYTVPSTATAPMLTTAKAEALNVSVGAATAPPVGPPATKVTVSLKPADLMKAPGQPSAAPTAPPAATAPKPTPAARAPVRHPAPPKATAAPSASPPPEPAAANTTGQ